MASDGEAMATRRALRGKKRSQADEEKNPEVSRRQTRSHTASRADIDEESSQFQPSTSAVQLSHTDGATSRGLLTEPQVENMETKPDSIEKKDKLVETHRGHSHQPHSEVSINNGLESGPAPRSRSTRSKSRAAVASDAAAIKGNANTASASALQGRGEQVGDQVPQAGSSRFVRSKYRGGVPGQTTLLSSSDAGARVKQTAETFELDNQDGLNKAGDNDSTSPLISFIEQLESAGSRYATPVGEADSLDSYSAEQPEADSANNGSFDSPSREIRAEIRKGKRKANDVEDDEENAESISVDQDPNMFHGGDKDMDEWDQEEIAAAKEQSLLYQAAKRKPGESSQSASNNASDLSPTAYTSSRARRDADQEALEKALADSQLELEELGDSKELKLYRQNLKNEIVAKALAKKAASIIHDGPNNDEGQGEDAGDDTDSEINALANVDPDIEMEMVLSPAEIEEQKAAIHFFEKRKRERIEEPSDYPNKARGQPNTAFTPSSQVMMFSDSERIFCANKECGKLLTEDEYLYKFEVYICMNTPSEGCGTQTCPKCKDIGHAGTPCLAPTPGSMAAAENDSGVPDDDQIDEDLDLEAVGGLLGEDEASQQAMDSDIEENGHMSSIPAEDEDNDEDGEEAGIGELSTSDHQVQSTIKPFRSTKTQDIYCFDNRNGQPLLGRNNKCIELKVRLGVNPPLPPPDLPHADFGTAGLRRTIPTGITGPKSSSQMAPSLNPYSDLAELHGLPSYGPSEGVMRYLDSCGPEFKKLWEEKFDVIRSFHDFVEKRELAGGVKVRTPEEKAKIASRLKKKPWGQELTYTPEEETLYRAGVLLDQESELPPAILQAAGRGDETEDGEEPNELDMHSNVESEGDEFDAEKAERDKREKNAAKVMILGGLRKKARLPTSF